MGKTQADKAEAAAGVTLRLSGKVVRPWGSVRSAWQAQAAAHVHLARATARVLWSRPSCQAACWGRQVDRDKRPCGPIEVREGLHTMQSCFY